MSEEQTIGMGHNSGVQLDEYAATVKARVADAEASEKASAALVVETSRETLVKLREAGQALNDAKAMLADGVKGAFGRWCAENFTFSKTWRARLMLVAANYDAMVAAVEALPEEDRSWSIDRVVATWKASQRSNAEPKPRKPPKSEDQLRAENAKLVEELKRERRNAKTRYTKLRNSHETWLAHSLKGIVADIEEKGAVALPDGRSIVIVPAPDGAEAT